jgi:ABC-type nitrate/sulfonate/bicarbonate transport system permease component
VSVVDNIEAIDLPSVRRRKKFLDRKDVRSALPWVVFILGFGLWEFFVRIFEIQQFVLPAPSAIFESLWQWRWIILRIPGRR